MKPVLLTAYGAAWRLARPWLRRHKRLSTHFAERLVPEGWERGLFAQPEGQQLIATRLWIHAASGGEAYLARELVRELRERLPEFSVFCTAMTEQGVEVLAKVREEFQSQKYRIAVNYFPLDEPGLMRRALAQVFGPPYGWPRAVVLLETEIWPGLLWACREYGVQSYIINGRMTAGSLKAYGKITGTLRRVAPDAILATTPEDAERFRAVFGMEGHSETVVKGEERSFEAHANMEKSQAASGGAASVQAQNACDEGFQASPDADKSLGEAVSSEPIFGGTGQQDMAAGSPASRVSLMPNIKFDRALPVDEDRPNRLLPLLERGGRPQVILLASVREEEESELQGVIARLREGAPEACTIVAPRHLHRAEAWEGYLGEMPGFGRRTKGVDALRPGAVVLWDTFGELFDLYGLADAVFVGGSLAPLGGQNFLEPLSFGLRPVIGPFWSNFYWVGREPFELGLVRQARNGPEADAILLEQLRAANDKATTKQIFSGYLSRHQGGSKLAAGFLIKKVWGE